MTDIILRVAAIVCISLSVYMLVRTKHYVDQIKAEAERQHNTSPTEKTQQKKTKKTSTNRYLDVVTFCEFLVKENSPLLTTIRPLTGRPNIGPIYRKFLKKFPKLTYQTFHKHYIMWEKSRQKTQKDV